MGFQAGAARRAPLARESGRHFRHRRIWAPSLPAPVRDGAQSDRRRRLASAVRSQAAGGAVSKEALAAVRVGIDDAVERVREPEHRRVGSAERLHGLAGTGRGRPHELQLQGDSRSVAATTRPAAADASRAVDGSARRAATRVDTGAGAHRIADVRPSRRADAGRVAATTARDEPADRRRSRHVRHAPARRRLRLRSLLPPARRRARTARADRARPSTGRRGAHRSRHRVDARWPSPDAG